MNFIFCLTYFCCYKILRIFASKIDYVPREMSKQEQDKSYFVAFCIEQYKAAKGMDGADVAKLFFAKGVASYLADNFEVLHTQSRQWLIEEIDEYINQEK